MVWLLALLAAAVSAAAGAYVALQKGRPPAEGAILGLALGPFGVVAEGTLPDVEAAGPVEHAAAGREETYYFGR